MREKHTDMDTLLSVPIGFISGLEAQSELRELLDELYCFYCDNLVVRCREISGSRSHSSAPIPTSEKTYSTHSGAWRRMVRG